MIKTTLRILGIATLALMLGCSGKGSLRAANPSSYGNSNVSGGNGDPLPTVIPSVPVPFTAKLGFGTTPDFSFDASKILIENGVASLRSVSQIDQDNTMQGFAGGTFGNAIWRADLNAVTLANPAVLQGVFVSRLMDAGAPVAWTKLQWMPERPYGKPLPNGRAIETAYPAGNADMSSNVLLLHMDETNPMTIVDSSGNPMITPEVSGNIGLINGRLGGGRDFPGVLTQNTNYVKVRNFSNFPTTQITVSLWVRRPRGYSQCGTLIGYSRSGVSGDFQINSSCMVNTTGGPVYQGLQIHRGGMQSISNAKLPEDERWHHVAATYVAGGATRLFVDGLEPDPNIPNGNLPLGAGGTFAVGIANSPVDNFAGGSSFNGEIDEVAVFNQVLPPSAIQDMYRRGAVRLKMAVRACDDFALCLNAPFSADMSEPTVNPALPMPGFTLPPLGNHRYFQYRATFESDSPMEAARLKSVTVGPAHYDSSLPTLTSLQGASFTTLSGFSETVLNTSDGQVRYQLSPNGSQWFYFNGSGWSSAANTSQVNTVAQVNSNIARFKQDTNASQVFVRAFLISQDGLQSIQMSDITLTGTR